MKVQIQPLQEQIAFWIENHVPEKDLFFLREQDLKLLQNDLEGVLVMPRAEFFEHTSYNGIQWVNSYMYWTISKEVQFVIVAQPDWVNNLSIEIRKGLLEVQPQVGRGLLFHLSYFSEIGNIPPEYIFNEGDKQGLIVRNEIWMKLPYVYKEEAIRAYAKEYEDWMSLKVPDDISSHLLKYANKFPTEHGANCLAATLFAISLNSSKNEWMINEWIHDQTFIETLKNLRYSKVEGKFSKGDIIVWVNEDDDVQHATYCIDNQLLFNKNGQTCFNPWKIVRWEELKEEWGKFKPVVYRKAI